MHRRTAAYAGSVMLRAEGRGSTRTCFKSRKYAIQRRPAYRRKTPRSSLRRQTLVDLQVWRQIRISDLHLNTAVISSQGFRNPIQDASRTALMLTFLPCCYPISGLHSQSLPLVSQLNVSDFFRVALITPPPIGERSIVMSVSVSLCVCVCVCLSVRDHIFVTTSSIFTGPLLAA